MYAFCNVYIDIHERVSSYEVAALFYTLFSARNSASDLIAYDEFLEE